MSFTSFMKSSVAELRLKILTLNFLPLYPWVSDLIIILVLVKALSHVHYFGLYNQNALVRDWE